MNYVYCKTNIYYEFYKTDDSVTNVFLHGWGRSSLDFKEIYKGQNYLLIDFPPFGKSNEPQNWSVYTYANMVICLLRHLNIKKINLIGHSFGGRIAIILSGMENELVNKLILVDSAGIKPKRKIKSKLKILKYKIYKAFHLNLDKFGSSDYKSLSTNMKKTFVNIVNTNLEENAKLIETNTLIIYGENDPETPLYMAIKLKKLIKNSKLIVIKNTGHFCFLERKIIFNEEISNFLEG